MKKLSIVFLLLVSIILKSQDTIFLVNKVKEIAKVLEINPTTTKYTLFEMPDGPTIIADNNTITKIIFKNGLVKTFVYINPILTQTTSLLYANDVALLGNGADTLKTDAEFKNAFYNKGIRDANLYYGKKSGAIGTGFLSFFCLPCGLICAVSCADSEPKTVNLNYPNPNLFINESYQLGYITKAHKIKKEKVWSSFITFGVLGVVTTFFLVSSKIIR